jgi:activator of HSP90 ATPase
MIEHKIVIPGATANAIYSLLLDSKKHSQLIGDKATIDPVVGGLFSAFSGYADGKTTKLIPNKLIEQIWRASDWEDDHYSTIRFELSDVEGGAQILFTQSNLPEGTEAEFEDGWQDNYWEPLLKYFS